MDFLSLFSIFVLSVLYARLLKSTVNWLNVDGFQIGQRDLKMELFCIGSWLWGSISLPPMEGTIFALLAGILFAISWIDFHTFQIPLIFMNKKLNSLKASLRYVIIEKMTNVRPGHCKLKK